MIEKEEKTVYICNFCGDRDYESNFEITIMHITYHLCFTCRSAIEKELEERKI